MGKDLKGRECGKGICQRKGGYYTARFTPKYGERQEKYFKKLVEARNWIADSKYPDSRDRFNASSDMTVIEWYAFSSVQPGLLDSEKPLR